MSNPLITYFKNHLTLSSEESDFLIEKVPVVDFGSNAFLLKEGEVSTSFFFIIKGFIRMYYLVDGIEKTTFFYGQNDFVSSYESFTKSLPSKHYLQTLKETQVAIFKADVVYTIINKYPNFEALSRIVMEEELSIYQEMIASFITLNAEQRYIKLLKEKPHLLQEVPQYHIATYLGVSPETLSRIKNRLGKKKLL